MALGDALQKRMEELAKRQPELRKRFMDIAKTAAVEAVREAQDNTPPDTTATDEIKGVHSSTGELAQHWETDSQTIPLPSGREFITTLANDKDYASYVNDGHRMDKHYVPGLYVDDDGLLSIDPAGDVGMMVGTKTKYVDGLYMKEAGIEKFKEVSEAELRNLAGEIFR